MRRRQNNSVNLSPIETVRKSLNDKKDFYSWNYDRSLKSQQNDNFLLDNEITRAVGNKVPNSAGLVATGRAIPLSGATLGDYIRNRGMITYGHKIRSDRDDAAALQNVINSNSSDTGVADSMLDRYMTPSDSVQFYNEWKNLDRKFKYGGRKPNMLRWVRDYLTI